MTAISESDATAAWPKPLGLTLRLILSYALVIGLAHRYGRDAVEAVMPLFRTLISVLDEHNRVMSLGIVNDGADTLVRMRVGLVEDIVIEGRLFTAGNFAFLPSIGIGLILQPAFIAMGLILAWPVRRAMEYPLRLAVAMVMLALVLVTDTPLTLWANYVHTIIDHKAFSLLWWWEEFLVNGGRLALGLVTALVAIKMAGRFSQRTAAI